jgi:hypothetical protein
MNRTITTVALGAAAALAIGGCGGGSGKADPTPTASTTTESPIPVTPTVATAVTARQLAAKMHCPYKQETDASQVENHVWEQGYCQKSHRGVDRIITENGAEILTFISTEAQAGWLGTSSYGANSWGIPVVVGNRWAIYQLTPQQATIIAKQTGGSVLQPAGN